MALSRGLAIKELEELKEKLANFSLTTHSWFDEHITDIDHQDPIWYDGLLWEIEMMNRFRMCFKAVGEVNMSWNDDEESVVVSTLYGKGAYERARWLHEHGIVFDSDIYTSDELYIKTSNHYELLIYDMRTGAIVYEEKEWKMNEYGLPLECEPEWLYSLVKGYLEKAIKREEACPIFGE